MWAAGFVVLAALQVAGRAASADRTWLRVDNPLYDVYYVDAHLHWLIPLGAVLIVFAVAYLALEQFRRGPRRRKLGVAHFAMTYAGVLTILGPMLLAPVLPASSQHVDHSEVFLWWNRISATGYMLALLGQLFFVAVLLDALRREPEPR